MADSLVDWSEGEGGGKICKWSTEGRKRFR